MSLPDALLHSYPEVFSASIFCVTRSQSLKQRGEIDMSDSIFAPILAEEETTAIL